MIKIKSNTEILSALTEYQRVKHYGLKSGIENLDHVMRLDRQRFCIIKKNHFLELLQPHDGKDPSNENPFPEF